MNKVRCCCCCNFPSTTIHSLRIWRYPPVMQRHSACKTSAAVHWERLLLPDPFVMPSLMLQVSSHFYARLVHAYYAHHNRFHAYHVHHNIFQQETVTAGVVSEVRKRKPRTKLIYFICVNDRLIQSLFYSFVDAFSPWLIQWNVRCLTNTSLSVSKSVSKLGRQWDSQ